MDEILKQHNHKIWPTYDNKWATYVYDKTKEKNRRLIKRSTKDEIYEYLYNFYNGILPKKKLPVDIEKEMMLEEIKNDFSTYKEINIWGIKTAAYLISPAGHIYSCLTKTWRSETIDHQTKTYKGQKYVLLQMENSNKQKRFSVARLTLAMFTGLPPEDMKDPTVDHIDGDTLNNYYKNLRWVERDMNSSLRKNRGIGENNGRAILTQKDVIHICNLLVKGKHSISDIASKYGVSDGAIMSIKEKRNWKYITSFFEF